MKHIYVLLLSIMLTNLNAQQWILTDSLPGFITDMEFYEGERYVTYRTGEVLRGDSILFSLPVQPGQETGLLSITWWNGILCTNTSDLDSVQRIVCGQDTVLAVSYKSPWAHRHRGGDMFVHSGNLYVSFGYGADPWDAQDSLDYRGKIIEVTDSTTSIYASGLRNGWKMDFKGDTFYIADVGAQAWEEVNRIDTSGINLGWPCWEGNVQNDTTCGVTMGPLYVYPRKFTGNAIIGGKLFQEAFWWCDNYYEFGGRTYDSGFTDSIPCPQYPVGMAVNGDTLLVYDYTGKIYRWENAPLSIDEEEEEQESGRPGWEEEAYNQYVDRMIYLYGGDPYMTMDRKIVNGLPDVPGIYWSLIRRKGYAVLPNY